MNIYCYAAEGKLPGVDLPDILDVTEVGDDPWFWVVHPAGSNAKEFVESYTEIVGECLKRGGAILFISGAKFGNLSESEALELERKTKDRIHCLRVACPDTSHETTAVTRIKQFITFIQSLPPHVGIPWEKVEPPVWPEHLVAAYLVLKALETSPKDADRIRKAWNEADILWRIKLWEEAWREYREDLGLDGGAWKDVGLPTPEETQQTDLPEPASISQAVDVIKAGFSPRT